MAKPNFFTVLLSLFFMLRGHKKLSLTALAGVIAAFFFGGGVDMLSPLPEGQCKVLNVYDGDTMTLQCSGQKDKTKVRMYCIDTPEMKQGKWGREARDHLRDIAGTRVKLREIDRDRYGRTVGEVFTEGGVNLNLAQVEAGQAAVYAAYCKKPEYSQAQEKAQRAKSGIWSKKGLHQTPWDWRKKNK